mgnify:CR=1 FL=1
MMEQISVLLLSVFREIPPLRGGVERCLQDLAALGEGRRMSGNFFFLKRLGCLQRKSMQFSQSGTIENPGNAGPSELNRRLYPQKRLPRIVSTPTLAQYPSQDDSLFGPHERGQNCVSRFLGIEGTSCFFPFSKITFPFFARRQVSRYDGQIVRPRRAHDVDRSAFCPKTKKKAAVASLVFWIILNDLSLFNH